MTNRHPLYPTWRAMKTRCLNPRHHNFARYGGRGITLCERWKDSFESFLADVGERPSPDHQLDRIDNNRGYEPGNVRWATRVQQAANRRDNVFLEAFGQRLLVKEWSRLTGVDAHTIRFRLRRGKSAEQALAPVRGHFARQHQGQPA
jgi:hypothetical protein